MSDLNLNPYTVDVPSTSSAGMARRVCRDGQQVGVVLLLDEPSVLEALLNAAYVKGVEDEKAHAAAHESARWNAYQERDDELCDQSGIHAVPDADGLTPRERAVSLLVATYGFTREIADRLVIKVGVNCPAAFEGVEVSDLIQDNVFTQAEAEDIMSKVNPS